MEVNWIKSSKPRAVCSVLHLFSISHLPSLSNDKYEGRGSLAVPSVPTQPARAAGLPGLAGASFALAVQDLLQLQIAPGFFYRALSHSEPDGWRRTGLVSPLLTHTCLLSSHLPTVVPHFQHHKSRIEIPEFGPRSKPHLQGIKTFVCIIRVGLAESGCSVLLTPNGAE